MFLIHVLILSDQIQREEEPKWPTVIAQYVMIAPSLFLIHPDIGQKTQ